MPIIRTYLEEKAIQLGEALGKDDLLTWGLGHEQDGAIVLVLTYPDGQTVEWTGRKTDGERDVA